MSTCEYFGKGANVEIKLVCYKLKSVRQEHDKRVMTQTKDISETWHVRRKLVAVFVTLSDLSRQLNKVTDLLLTSLLSKMS